MPELSQMAAFLLSYIGIDQISEKEVVYRMLDTQVAFHGDLPIKGDTIFTRMEFLEYSQRGSTTLAKYRMTSYCKNELIIYNLK
jgi:hypothetical protein